MSSGVPEITHGEAAGVTQTDEDSLIPPGSHAMNEDAMPALLEQRKLQEFLQRRFPEEVNRTNAQRPETPAEIAIRLLGGLATRGSNRERCEKEYCNLPKGHLDACRWVHFN